MHRRVFPISLGGGTRFPAAGSDLSGSAPDRSVPATLAPVEELLLGAGIGLAAGVSPGPLLSLVVANTLERGFGAGARVALAPLLTDAPIIALTVLAVDALPSPAVRGLAAAGGLYLVFLAAQILRRAPTARVAGSEVTASRRDLWQGVVANTLSPHPWLFWLGAGAPLLNDAWRRAPARGVAFLAGFYGLLVGTKVLLARVVATSRRRLSPRWYPASLAAAGALLAAVGVLLLWQATVGGGLGGG